MSRLPERTDTPERHELPVWRRLLRVVWLVLTVAGLAWAVQNHWSSMLAALREVDRLRLLLSALFAVAGVGVSGQVWRCLLTGMGYRLDVTPALRVFFVGQLGKYLPGSIWPVLAQMELGRDLGVPPRASAAAVAVFLWVHLVTGAAVALPLLAGSGVLPPWAGAASAPILVLLVAHLMEKALRFAMRVTRREPLERHPDQTTILLAAGWALAMWTFYGLHLWNLVPAGAPVGVLAAGGTFAAAWTLGFLFVIAPAGVGAREGVFLAVLSGSLTLGGALAVAVASRALLTVADALWGVVGLLGVRLSRPTARHRPYDSGSPGSG